MTQLPANPDRRPTKFSVRDHLRRRRDRLQHLHANLIALMEIDKLAATKLSEVRAPVPNPAAQVRHRAATLDARQNAKIKLGAVASLDERLSK